MFEFGAVLFLASIFQGTLLYASVYALVRSASAVVLSSWLGSKMDRSNRLVAIRHSIGRSLLLPHITTKLMMNGYMTAYTS
jgi:iron-regulated transporter 1